MRWGNKEKLLEHYRKRKSFERFWIKHNLYIRKTVNPRGYTKGSFRGRSSLLIIICSFTLLLSLFIWFIWFKNVLKCCRAYRLDSGNKQQCGCYGLNMVCYLPNSFWTMVSIVRSKEMGTGETLRGTERSAVIDSFIRVINRFVDYQVDELLS